MASKSARHLKPQIRSVYKDNLDRKTLTLKGMDPTIHTILHESFMIETQTSWSPCIYKRLSGFHTKCLRKICKIYWPRKITNKDLYVRTGHKDLITVIKQRQLRWLVHVFRKGNHSITKTALKWTPAERKRSRGRPRET